MHGERARILQVKFVLCDLAATAAAFFLSYWIRDSLLENAFGELYPLASYLWIFLLAMLSIPVIFIALKMYEVDGMVERKTPLYRRAGRVLQGMALEYVLLSVLVFSLKLHYVSRLFVALFIGVAFLLLVLARASLWPVLLRRTQREPLRVVIVGTGESARELAALFSTRPRIATRLLGFLTEQEPQAEQLAGHPVLGSVDQAESIFSKQVVDEVLIAVSEKSLSELEPLLLLCEQRGITARVAWGFLSRGSARLYLEQLEGIPLLTFTTTPTNANLLAFKRVTDVVVSLGLLILCSPLFVLVPLLIRLTSRGPVLYEQVRCGLNGRRFTFLKFRSMIEGADEKRDEVAHLNEAKGPIFKISADPRVTSVGRFLRRTSIDELPQLFNVLKGEMSLVGPRPPLPEEVERYESWQRRRLSMKPGLTCVWQVSGRSELTFDEWVALDLKYIDDWSPWLDFRIMLNTIPAVLLRKGAW